MAVIINATCSTYHYTIKRDVFYKVSNCLSTPILLNCSPTQGGRRMGSPAQDARAEVIIDSDKPGDA